MKILFLCQYITLNDSPIFSRNKTGYGFMVKDIAVSVAKSEEVDLLTMSYFNPEIQHQKVLLLKRSKWDIIRFFNIKYLILWLKSNKYPVPFKRNLYLLYYYMSLGYVNHIIKKGKYDLVHIHGLGTITEGYIECCKQYKIPFLITLHGLNSFSESIPLTASEKQYERDFLLQAAEEKISLSFISSGDLQTVEKFVKKKCSNFYLINNGCDIKEKPYIENIRKRYSINQDNFVFVCVGNISINKNQIQACRAYNLLPIEIKKRIKILFVGGMSNGSKKVINYINTHQLENSLIICGAVDKEKMSDYYQAANATILLSFSEGFGLSIIEGFVYGLPSLTFSDLSAIDDVYNQEAMYIVKERSDKVLIEAMLQMIKHNWDREKIKKYSKKFSFEIMADKYIELYCKIINNKK